MEKIYSKINPEKLLHIIVRKEDIKSLREDIIPENNFLQSDILIIAITSKDIDGFENLIAQIENSSIQKVIFISSTSVYARLNKVMTEEDEVLKTPLTAIENRRKT